VAHPRAVAHHPRAKVHPSTARPTVIAAVLAALFALALAGCGSSGGSAPDPATVVPAYASLYVSAVVRPEGSLESNTLNAARKLTHSNAPFAGLTQALRAPGGRKLDYTSEVKPWLGPHAGAFVASVNAGEVAAALTERLGKTLSGVLSGSGAAQLGEEGLQALLAAKGVQGALVLDTADAGKARAFLEARARETGAHAASYRGVSYEVSPSGQAAGLVGSFAVIGTEGALHQVIEVKQGAAALVHAAGYVKLTSSAESGALANLYLDASGLLGSASTSTSGASLAPLLGGALAGVAQAYLSLIPNGNSIALDIDTTPSPSAPAGSSLIPNTSAAQVTGQLPGGSWLAAGVANVSGLGKGVQGLDALASLLGGVSIGSFNLKGLFVPLHSRDLDVSRDLLSWIGSAAVFAAGSNLLNLQAGLVFSSTNPTLSTAAVAKIARAYSDAGAQVTPTTIAGAETAVTVKLSSFPVILAVGANQSKLAIGFGTTSVQEALNPTSTLASSAAYTAAATTLGHGIQPSVLVDFPTMLSLIETLGLSQAAGVSSVVPYLQSLTTLAAGGGESLGGGVTRARVVLGLAQSG
jgi:hypothetical protein